MVTQSRLDRRTCAQVLLAPKIPTVRLRVHQHEAFMLGGDDVGSGAAAGTGGGEWGRLQCAVHYRKQGTAGEPSTRWNPVVVSRNGIDGALRACEGFGDS